MPREMSENARREREDAIKQRLKYRQLRKTTNASLRCGANCHDYPPTPQKCAACKNPSCVKAFDDLEAFWQEKDRC